MFASGETRDVSTQSCTTGCDCDVRCATDHCKCDNYDWYYQEYEECYLTDQDECICSWNRSGCDCQGSYTEHCPEP